MKTRSCKTSYEFFPAIRKVSSETHRKGFLRLSSVLLTSSAISVYKPKGALEEWTLNNSCLKRIRSMGSLAAEHLEIDDVYTSGDLVHDDIEKPHNNPRLNHVFQYIHGSLGLFVNEDGTICKNAGIRNGTRSISFGCKRIPTMLIEKTLKEWQMTNKHRVLERMVITWQDEVNNRRNAAENMDVQWKHIWSLSTHAVSPFFRANIESYRDKSNNKDLVDIYFLSSADNERSAVVTFFAHGISIDFGLGSEIGRMMVMKKAFAYATKISNLFFEIDMNKIN